jgi:hypothetical protein
MPIDYIEDYGLPRTVQVFAGYVDNSVRRQIGAGGVAVRYQRAATSNTPTTDDISAPMLTVNLMPLLKGGIVPGSLRFKIGSYTYIDRNGTLYRDISRATGAGTAAGTINYATGKLSVTDWPNGSPTFTLEAGLVNPGTPGVSTVEGRTDARPVKSQSFSIAATATDGTLITAVAAADGTVTGTNVAGSIDLETGIYTLAFGTGEAATWTTKLVDPSTLRYNAVSYSYLPLDATIIGLDPVRLPQDGRVPIFRRGTYAVIGHTSTVGPYTVSNAQTKDCGRVRLSRVRVIGNDGNVITTGYTEDLEAGTVTFTDVTGYSQPVTIEHRIEDMAQVSDVQINGDLTLTRAISHAYPTGSVVSSALVAGDLHARVAALFDQSTWTGVWQDTIIGSAATATYNDVLAPIEVKNNGAGTERWAIKFTSTTAFDVIGEHVGVIANGNINTDCAPVNPATGNPYFTIRALGWGTGWSIGNVLRFNTVGSLFPVWVIRTVQQGVETVTDDSFTILVRGDVDHP